MIKIYTAFFVCFSWMGIAQESFVLSSESILTIAGTSTVHDWQVRANSVSGSMTAMGELVTDLKIEVEVAAIKSERGPTMDNKMYGALKAEEHPLIVFELKEANQKNGFAGGLSIAGVEREINVEGKLSTENNNLSISGEQEILFKDYGMEPPTAMFGQIVVGDSVTIKFELIFTKN